jgi:hypothetical protein
MGLQYSVAVNNARLDSIEATAGATAKLMVYTGAMPANCAAAATGTLLATLTLPSDWMSAASAGVKSKLGTWTGTASATGTAGYCRIYDNAGTTCHIQGDAGLGSGTFQFDNTSLATGQSVTVNTFQLTAGNA